MPKSKSKSSISAETLALYEKLVATNPDVERKGAKVPYTSANGTMSSFLTAYGKAMQDWAAVPVALLAKTSILKKYFDMAHEHARKLKGKKK